MESVSERRERARLRRHRRVRKRVVGTPDRPRLSVHRGGQGFHAQVIDDLRGVTLVAVSTQEAALRDQLPVRRTVGAATVAGSVLAERAKARGIGRVVFDRGGYRYHGRVKAFADAARQGGLEF